MGGSLRHPRRLRSVSAKVTTRAAGFLSAALIALLILSPVGAGQRRAVSAVAPPLPPSSYALPKNAVYVRSSQGLVRALRHEDANIVLADGVYGNQQAFADLHASSIYAEHLGRAKLTASILVSGKRSNGWAVIRGLAFDVTDLSKTAESSDLELVGRGARFTSVLDSTFEGHGVISWGLLALNPRGLVAQRLTFAHFTDVGLRASDNVPVSEGTWTPQLNTVTDISVNDVAQAVPGSSNGTGEAGVWIGEPVVNGVHRIRIRDTAWSGLETCNNVWNTEFTDLDIDMSGQPQGRAVGVYLEHYTRNDAFTRFKISGARIGFNAEWDLGVAGNAGAHDVVISHGTIDANGSPLPNTVGIYLDQGTESTTVKSVRFIGQTMAGIAANATTGQNVFGGNNWSGLRPGAVQIMTSGF